MKSISLLAKSCLGVLLIASVIVSCKKNNSAEKPASGFGRISYFAKASGSGVRTSASPDSALQPIAVSWASATVWVEKISFTAQGDGLLDTTIMVEKNLNIFSANALAGVVQLPVGSYKNVKVKMYCKKFSYPELAFNFRGTFTNTFGMTDSVITASSYPFEADLSVNDIVIDPSDNYKATFNFDLSKVLAGITTQSLERGAHARIEPDGTRSYFIWKGGSQDEPFYDQVIQNMQSVASVIITKEPQGPAN